MVTFRKTEGKERSEAEAYLGLTAAETANVYAAYEDGLTGAGILVLQAGSVTIAAWKAEEENREFVLRSLIYAASLPGLPVAGTEPALARFGFTAEDGVYTCAAKDIRYPSECGREENL